MQIIHPPAPFDEFHRRMLLTVPTVWISQVISVHDMLRHDTDSSRASLNVVCRAIAVLLIWSVALSRGAVAQLEFEGAPINYETASVRDPVSLLQRQLERKEESLSWDDRHGWLKSVLEKLSIPQSSQLLVFSKTSLQLRRIMPSRPRALYFSDDTYVGWVQRGDVVEVSTVDPELGAIFYTLRQEKTDSPRFVRDRGQCLICHASSRTKNVPGHLVRSVYPGRDGQPHFGLGTITTDHRTPFEERFGGWYVTGTHGSMRHLGNAIADDNRRDPIDPEPGANLTSLKQLVRTSPYLQPTSDLIALMTLEHQSQMHNVITFAAYETRRAMHHDSVMNEALKRPNDFVSESTGRRISSAADKLVEYMLFCDEYPLTSAIAGVSEFAADFSERGPRDGRGRSLRDFDLKTRLFRYPCSFLIYSSAFDALPEPMLDAVYTRLFSILDSSDDTAGDENRFRHLSGSDRVAIREILMETKPEFRQRMLAISKAIH